MNEQEKAALRALAEGLVENSDRAGLEILIWQSRFVIELAELKLAQKESEHAERH